MSNKNDEKEINEEIQEEILEEIQEENDEVLKLKDALSRVNADYQNFKTRVDRDRLDMIFFLKQDIFNKILPRLDDLERIILNTKEEEKNTSIYTWILSMEKSFKRDLEGLWLKSFESVWLELDPEKHEVMTQIPSETPWIIVSEFEKWYLLWDRVVRVSKVVVWS